MTRQAAARPSDGNRPNPGVRRRSGWRWLSGLALVTLALGLGILLGYGVAYRSDYILGNVYLADIHLGNQTRAETRRLLQQQWARQAFFLTDGQRRWPVTAADLGLQIDGEQAIALAYAYGRTLDDPLGIVRALTQRLEITPRRQYDPARAAATLAAFANKVALPAVDAHLEIRAGQAQAIPAQSGRALDVTGTLDQWATAQATILSSREAALVIRLIAPAVSDVSAQAAEANRLLAQPPTLRGYDPVTDEWVTLPVSAETWAAWLSFPPQAGALTYSLDLAAISAFLESRSAGLGSDRAFDPADAEQVRTALMQGDAAPSLRIYHSPTAYTVQAGETFSSIGTDHGIPYPWIQAANPGVDTLYAGQVITIPSPDDLIPLPPVPNKRLVVSLSRQHLWAYENGALKWDWVISTGIPDSPTAPGVFQIQSHELEAYANSWDLYMPYFMGIYSPAPNIDFMNGFHGFPTRDGRNLLWTNNLGTPVTYGCILVSNENVQSLYAWAETGVVVAVTP